MDTLAGIAAAVIVALVLSIGVNVLIYKWKKSNFLAVLFALISAIIGCPLAMQAGLTVYNMAGEPCNGVACVGAAIGTAIIMAIMAGLSYLLGAISPSIWRWKQKRKAKGLQAIAR